MKKRNFTVLLAAAMTVNPGSLRASFVKEQYRQKQRRHQQAKACPRRPRESEASKRNTWGGNTGTGSIG